MLTSGHIPARHHTTPSAPRNHAIRLSISLAILLLAQDANASERFASEMAARQHCPHDTVAWLNTASGKLHQKGSKWYGRSQVGAYVCQQATAARQTSPENKKQGAVKWKALAVIDAFNGGATLYYEHHSIQKQGAFAEMLVLMDFRQAQEAAGTKFLSSELRKQYDCEKKLWRILASAAHNKNMGRGQTVHADDEPGDWTPVEPESVVATEWEKACSMPGQD